MDISTIDIPTIIAALLSSGILSLGAARWLATRLVDHRLAKDLKDHQEALDEKIATWKAELDRRLATAKAEVEATLRKEVEEYLGDKAADRQYRLDARKRLYAAIGPLRFQLVVACADFAARVDRIGSGKQPYAMSLAGYFGRSTTFRLLRLFAVAELIERQMAFADFSVDPSTADLLRFKHEAFLCLSSSTISLDHPRANWDVQVEHVFYDTLSLIAAALIVDDGPARAARAMRFDEFNQLVSGEKTLTSIHPIPQLMQDFTIDTKPILWIRFVALGELCSSIVKRDSPPLGITPEPYDGAKMLRASKDKFVTENLDRYVQVLQRLRTLFAGAPT